MTRQAGAPPGNGAARSVVPPTPRADFVTDNGITIPTRKVFDEQPLAEFAGYVVLSWRPIADGDRFGFAKVRLPNVADTDLFVSLHCDGRRLWAEAVPDTPRRCRRRLERALPLLCQLIARALGGDALGQMLRQRVAHLGQPDGISPSRMAEMLEVDKAGQKVRC
jgi:hypothetical protein